MQGDVADHTAALRLLEPWYRAVGHKHNKGQYNVLSSGEGDLIKYGICTFQVLPVVRGYYEPSLALQTHGGPHV